MPCSAPIAVTRWAIGVPPRRRPVSRPVDGDVGDRPVAGEDRGDVGPLARSTPTGPTACRARWSPRRARAPCRSSCRPRPAERRPVAALRRHAPVALVTETSATLAAEPTSTPTPPSPVARRTRCSTVVSPAARLEGQRHRAGRPQPEDRPRRVGRRRDRQRPGDHQRLVGVGAGPTTIPSPAALPRSRAPASRRPHASSSPPPGRSGWRSASPPGRSPAPAGRAAGPGASRDPRPGRVDLEVRARGDELARALEGVVDVGEARVERREAEAQDVGLAEVGQRRRPARSARGRSATPRGGAARRGRRGAPASRGRAEREAQRREPRVVQRDGERRSARRPWRRPRACPASATSSAPAAHARRARGSAACRRGSGAMPRLGLVVRPHRELVALAEPALDRRAQRVLQGSAHVEEGRRARAGVEVLVGAADGEVGARRRRAGPPPRPPSG